MIWLLILSHFKSSLASADNLFHHDVFCAVQVFFAVCLLFFERLFRVGCFFNRDLKLLRLIASLAMVTVSVTLRQIPGP